MNQNNNTTNSSYRDTLKSMDTEETFDLWFYRPIGYAWACLAKRLGITPNAITIASIFLGVGGGILFYYNDLWINIIGMLLLVWANSFDSADGQLARMTKQYSRIGRILDGVSGDLWFIAIYFAICFRTNANSDFFSATPWLIWTIAIIAGIFHAQQAATSDYYRNFHLYFLKGEEGSELDSSAQIKEKLAQLSWSKNFFQKLILTFYANYTKSQERITPSMQRLRRAIAQRWNGGMPSQEFRKAFRAKSLPMMKYTNMLTFNTRTFALFVSLFIGMPWLYFAFELTMLNIMLIYMVCCHERFCRRFTKEIEDGKY
ncbi:MAG: CDP-alcohol phosphatidyltransferase family protein [Muribaculaceae bacterium]|nr:CDP-alcohol phosphatidyltransferase family protein [Muribaculaceae bacterium]